MYHALTKQQYSAAQIQLCVNFKTFQEKKHFNDSVNI